MLTVNTYTAQFDEAMRPKAPKLGAKVKIHDAPDAREADAFRRLLRANGLDTEWDRAQKNGFDVFTIVKAQG